ncbi:hypothetical protein N7520_003519 [Penicillium odoratum]|uniref:uncharacterized protein n=1 Tax=Penicillium odoratum TaxID=1167516 RepID=UPI002548217D|nr:uncharacterized protein N7520_003519 [Penicillium odoratum]KAJ5768960.1 hypothetical protein N7520_003519 [Penicillium odoratum]
MAHLECTARLLADVVKKARREEGDTATATTDSSAAPNMPSNAASFPDLEVSQSERLSSQKSSSDLENFNLDASWIISPPDALSEGRSLSTGPIHFGAQAGLDLCPTPSNVLLSSPPNGTETAPFSRRLQHYALERGYELIKNIETPLSILHYAFKHCFRVSSREEITSRLELLLQQSLQGAVLGPAKDLPWVFMSNQQSFSNKMFELTDPPALPTSPTHPMSDPETGLSYFQGDEFLSAKDVDMYLQSRGIMTYLIEQFVSLLDRDLENAMSRAL